jgi:hypothetical protein
MLSREAAKTNCIVHHTLGNNDNHNSTGALLFQTVFFTSVLIVISQASMQHTGDEQEQKLVGSQSG